MRQGRLSSYERENYNRTLELGILLADRFNCVASTAFAQIDVQNPESWATEARQISAAKINRQLPMESSPGVPTERRCATLAEAAALRCQGSAPASPPPLTAAAFRPRLLLGSGFGKFKAGALSFQREHRGLVIRQTTVAAIAIAHSLNSIPCVSRSWVCLLPCSMATDHSCPFLFASRVVFLASSEGRLNLSRGGAFSGVVVLLLGTLAAVPGCVKILRILFSLVIVPAFICCPSSRRGRSVCYANGETILWHTVNRTSKPAGNQWLADCKR
jgi:hypothetical protein